MALGLWLGMAAVVMLALWQLRHESLNSQAREMRLLSLAATDALERGLRGVEEGMDAVRSEVASGRLSLADASAARSLQTRAELMPLVRNIWVLVASDRVLAASNEELPPAPSSFVPSLQALRADGMALSTLYAALASEAGSAGESVAMAVRVTVPRVGDGWIVAALPSQSLLGAFGAALPLADARMLVVRSDGVRLASVNAASIAASDVRAALRAGHAPEPALQTFSDGSDKLVAVQSVPRYGVQVLVARDLDAVLATWRHAAELAAVGLAVLLVVMGAAVYLVQLADRRRAEAQGALQAQVARAGRLESLGTLAGGVAHDFNNVLAGIVGYGEMAQDAAVPGSAQARHLDKVMQAALRGKALVERILSFSRGGAKSSTVFEFQPVVDEVLTLLSASLHAGVELERRLEAPGACLKGDATQAFEAVMNLSTNAMQAMPQGGRLSVLLARQTIAEPQVLSHTQLAPGDYLTLAVADQGAGISPEVMDHLFEPFFTTKAAQSGTGLGLAVVFGVVAEFNGAIDVRSTPGQGACFTLYLPECKAAAVADAAEVPEQARGRGQRVLVVDDEPELVALAQEMLRGLGYVPEGCSDPEAALRLLQADPGGYDAMITDEVMPRLTGTQLTQSLREHAAELPVLLVSGYGGALLAQRAAAAGVTRVLAKPLQRVDLARALAEVLHAA